MTTPDEHADLARLATTVAADLEERHGASSVAPLLRRLARAVVELAEERRQPAADLERCRGCGQELEHPATGRRRVWCDERCRRRSRP